MITKLKKLLNLDAKKEEQENQWLFNKPIDRTLGLNVELSYPSVAQPTPKEINGKGLPVFPYYIALEVTNACNLRCTHCNYRYGLEHYTRDRGFATKETVERVLTEAKAHGSTVLMNYDGEPLMHKNFLDYLELATQMEVNTYFNTNGTLFNKEFTDRLIKFYKGSIFFSVDGNRNWFEKIRIPAKYDVLLENLNYLIKVNEENGWPITIGVSLCNLGQTPNERKDFLEEWLQRVNYVSMGEVNDKYGTMISDPMILLNIKKRPLCIVPWQTCGICFNGDIIPCSIYVTRANISNTIFGNIYKQTIQETWLGENFKNFRKMLDENNYNESFCSKCQRWRSQFSFPPVEKGDVKISRNGYWTAFQNLEKGDLNFL